MPDDLAQPLEDQALQIAAIDCLPEDVKHPMEPSDEDTGGLSPSLPDVSDDGGVVYSPTSAEDSEVLDIPDFPPVLHWPRDVLPRLAAPRPELPELVTGNLGPFRLVRGDKVRGVIRADGFQVTCPYHKLNKKTGCRRWFKLTGDESEEEHELLLRRLMWWCTTAQEFDRQRTHLRSILPQRHDLPHLGFLRAKLETMEAPLLGLVFDDQDLDERVVHCLDDVGAVPSSSVAVRSKSSSSNSSKSCSLAKSEKSKPSSPSATTSSSTESSLSSVLDSDDE